MLTSPAALQSFLEAAPDAIVIVDDRGRVQLVNGLAEQMFGYPRAELVGAQVELLVPERLRDGVELVGRRKDGSEFPIEIRSSPLASEVGPLAFVAIRDISERKLFERTLADARARRDILAQERSRLLAMLTHAPAAIAVLRGPDHVYELSNAMNNLYLGFDPTGRAAAEAVPGAVEQGLIAMLDRVYETGEEIAGTEIPARFPGPDGQPRDMHVNFAYQPLFGPTGTTEGVLVFAYDVTEQVNARREIERFAKEREQLVHELSEAVRARDEFLQIASHELKTPLTPLTLQLDTLARALARAGIDDPRIQARVETASRQTKRLTKLVESLLDVARITGGRLTLDPEPFDVCEVVREVVERFRREAETLGSDLDVRLCESTEVRWDRLRIEQIVSNLVSNAIKYGSGRPIDVVVRQDDENIRIGVTDYGIGIEPESLERVFGRFERAVSIRQFGGLGLGLYIAQQIAMAHGGAIETASELGRGSTFTIVLPRTVPTTEVQP